MSTSEPTWEEQQGQLALFPAPPHEHVFVKYKGPHVVCPEDTFVLEASKELWRPHDRTMRYCWGCRQHIWFDHEGRELPRDRKW